MLYSSAHVKRALMWLVSTSCRVFPPPAGSRGHLPSGAESCGIHHVYAPPRHRRYGLMSRRLSQTRWCLHPALWHACHWFPWHLLRLRCAEMSWFAQYCLFQTARQPQSASYTRPRVCTCVHVCACACVFVCPDSKINERDQTPAQLPLLFPWRPAQAV